MATLKEMRLGIIKHFQKHHVEVDIHLDSISANGDEIEFLGICDTEAITIPLIQDIVLFNEDATGIVRFLGGRLNASNPNTFLFRFRMGSAGSDGLC